MQTATRYQRTVFVFGDNPVHIAIADRRFPTDAPPRSLQFFDVVDAAAGIRPLPGVACRAAVGTANNYPIMLTQLFAEAQEVARLYDGLFDFILVDERQTAQEQRQSAAQHQRQLAVA